MLKRNKSSARVRSRSLINDAGKSSSKWRWKLKLTERTSLITTSIQRGARSTSFNIQSIFATVKEYIQEIKRYYYFCCWINYQLLQCNLIEALFEKFARIWMQISMWLRGIIPGIVFKLEMQLGAYSVLFQKQLPYANDKVLLLLFSHVIAKLRRYRR